MEHTWKIFFAAYKKVIGIIGKFNTTIILSIVYFLIIPIFSLLFLFKREPRLKTTWQTKEPVSGNSHEYEF